VKPFPSETLSTHEPFSNAFKELLALSRLLALQRDLGSCMARGLKEPRLFLCFKESNACSKSLLSLFQRAKSLDKQEPFTSET